MKTRDYIYCVIIALLVVILLSKERRINEVEQYVVDSQHFTAEMRETTMNCIPVTISGAGINEHRADVNLKFDVAVCENGLGQAVVYDSYEHFVEDMIAENEEWK